MTIQDQLAALAALETLKVLHRQAPTEQSSDAIAKYLSSLPRQVRELLRRGLLGRDATRCDAPRGWLQ